MKKQAAPVFVPGQRWISDSEAELGLGVVIALEGRMVQIDFPGADESRLYSQHNAPLTRIVFNEGDTIRGVDGRQLTVIQRLENRGLVLYLGRFDDDSEGVLPELDLDHVITLNKPLERLLAGQFESLEWYRLRHDTLVLDHAVQTRPAWGLGGARIGLIPHQLYIANEVASRFAPRVLLADEVGLGKTIEAGLILHKLLTCERASRILVIVPSALLYQWLVEMRRRFAHHFALFDENRWEGMLAENDDLMEYGETDDEAANPFEQESRVLVSLEFLLADPERMRLVNEARWDMLVVDEAHHLQWTPEHSSPAYDLVAQLAWLTPGTLLITATPEQLGVAGHFARLRLLDPNRFHDLASFEQEEARYPAIAALAVCLSQGEALGKESLQTLSQLLGDDDALQQQLDHYATGPDTDTGQALVDALLDRHGTGRILFRNTRAAVAGFPSRIPLPAALPLPEHYASLPAAQLLAPERAPGIHDSSESWCENDPRTPWLVDLLKRHRQDKFLLITHHADTVLELETCLRLRHGIRTAVFHEDMSLFERDRAAAWFADPEQGARILLCSEIGSEGRNFQFARHLVLFDLPRNPDLLEQRIGRLDRIGQQHDIQLHVPYFAGTPQETLLHLYHDAFNALAAPSPAAATVAAALAEQIDAALASGGRAPDALIEQARTQTRQLHGRIEQGRDRLLELNSFRPAQARTLIDALEHNDDSDDLSTYMTRLWDAFGVHHEDHSEQAWVLKPGEHMLVERFPYVEEDGITVSFSRERALAREDMEFLTWEHPMVRQSVEMITRNKEGNACICALKNKAISAGTLLLEALFVIEPTAPRDWRLDEQLPCRFVRILIDSNGKSLAAKVSHDTLAKQLRPLEKALARQALKACASALPGMVDTATALAHGDAAPLLEQARKSFVEHLHTELSRLQALRRINPSVREIELVHLERLLKEGSQAIGRAQLRLDAVNLVVAT